MYAQHTHNCTVLKNYTKENSIFIDQILTASHKCQAQASQGINILASFEDFTKNVMKYVGPTLQTNNSKLVNILKRSSCRRGREKKNIRESPIPQ